MNPFRSLFGRLVLGQVLVIAAGAVSLAVVAVAIAPAIFHQHVKDALGVVPSGEMHHLDQAFQDTLVLALAAAVGVAAITALAMSLLLAKRIADPIDDLADAAQRVASGELGVRVALTGADELRAVSASFNRLAEDLEASERERRAFISDVAHELRTPVATIDGYLEGLADGVVTAAPETWTMLRTQTDRMRRLIDDLTTLTRADEGRIDLRISPLDVTDVLEAAAAAAQPAFFSKRVALEIDAEHIGIHADPDRLGEVMANLLANALRHTPSDGTVTLRAYRTAIGVRIAVTDTGEGIPLDELERIFDRFHRIDPSRSRASGGSGLGLPISRALIQAHGGTIRAEPAPDSSGVRMIIDLPDAPDA
jgi:signal transduction histidine kinase